MMKAQTISLKCINTGTTIEVAGGITLSEVARQLKPQLPFRAICARVNNKTVGLDYAVYSPKKVEYLPKTTASGERVYIRSLCMVLYLAVHELCDGAGLRIDHSLSRGYFCHLTGVESVSAELIGRLRARMQDIIDRDLAFERHERLTDEVIEIFEKQGLDDKAGLLRTTHELYTVYYSLDGLCDSYYGNLAPSTGHLDVFDLVPYKDGMLLLGFEPERPDEARRPIAQEKMYKAFTDYVKFNHVLGVHNVAQLNQAVLHGYTPQLINVAEALHDKALARISDEITRRYQGGGARVVLLAGPSSSGKTTTNKRLAIQLMTNLLKPQMISLDDYFVDREHTPRDASGEYDYESLYALDLELFNSDLKRIISGERVELPTYNFESGRREYNGKSIQLGENSILLIEGIHGLNPELTSQIPEEMKYRVYVSALTTITIDDHNWISTTDNRLLRRIIRDHKYRGTSATETIRRWPSVRRGEERWIFPYQENADATFNSSLLFELGVVKVQAEEILKRVPHDVAEYSEAYRLLRFLSYFEPIGADLIPTTSLLREFLGGSSFKY